MHTKGHRYGTSAFSFRCVYAESLFLKHTLKSTAHSTSPYMALTVECCCVFSLSYIKDVCWKAQLLRLFHCAIKNFNYSKQFSFPRVSSEPSCRRISHNAVHSTLFPSVINYPKQISSVIFLHRKLIYNCKIIFIFPRWWSIHMQYHEVMWQQYYCLLLRNAEVCKVVGITLVKKNYT